MTGPARSARPAPDFRSPLRTGWAGRPIPGTVETWTCPTDRAGRGGRPVRHSRTVPRGEARQ
ncbi:hypothetical protein [Streptomyces apocyni]|uniref:hypothetical protein n=1 Tax=Streptomyces apocyni TaxID=2654677 RepID=UPI0012EAE548|nr:hypothetical protein [Streptomyces apocyni]